MLKQPYSHSTPPTNSELLRYRATKEILTELLPLCGDYKGEVGQLPYLLQSKPLWARCEPKYAPTADHFFFSASYPLKRKDYRLHFLSSERASIAFGYTPMQLGG